MRSRGPAKQPKRCKPRLGVVLSQAVDPRGVIGIRLGLQDGKRMDLELGAKEWWKLVANLRRQWERRAK